jgi:hydrogenase/urease accessory protein HupE
MRNVLSRDVWRPCLIAAVSCLAALVWPFGSPVWAHEAGTTQVKVLLATERGYTIEITTDATALAEKLEVLAGVTPSPDKGPARLQALLARSDEVFRRRLNVRFDGVDVGPAIEYSVSPQTDAGSPPLATVRLTGEIPQGARDFSWTYSWTFSSYALVMRNDQSDTPVTEWLDGGQPSSPFAVTTPAPPPNRAETAWRYLALGFTHILPYGLDHVLFVLGIFLLSGRARSVLWQVSAFTVAHTITLGLTMFGVIAASPAFVEPLIALSIAYVAIENLFLSELRSWRIALVFGFGLLHGLGFAGALQELGLPRTEFLTALLTFNLGVEAGQLAVIGGAFLLVGWQCANREWYRRRVVVPASLLIACTAIYWTVERALEVAE